MYAPRPDGRPDPGEIVWTWVPYEEDHSQGKDRPVLLVGRDGDWLLGLQLTSKDHDRDAEQERRAGRRWVDIGSGAWDRQGRPSEVRSTASCGSTRPRSAARVRSSTTTASSRWRPPCAPAAEVAAPFSTTPASAVFHALDLMGGTPYLQQTRPGPAPS